MSAREKWEQYLKLNGKYYEDALKLLAVKDYAQASEKLWGAVAEIVKAVAEKRGVHLKTHADLWGFVHELDRETPHLGVAEKFLVASHLHSNFYEDELPSWAVEKAAESVKTLISNLKNRI